MLRRVWSGDQTLSRVDGQANIISGKANSGIGNLSTFFDSSITVS